MPFAATWMDLETVMLSEVSQTEKKKYIIYMCNLLQKCYKSTYLQNRSHRCRKQTVVTKGESGAGRITGRLVLT